MISSGIFREERIYCFQTVLIYTSTDLIKNKCTVIHAIVCRKYIAYYLLFSDGQVIPGIAGKDYPTFAQTLLPRRHFPCRGLEGYFADISTRCQVTGKKL